MSTPEANKIPIKQQLIRHQVAVRAVGVCLVTLLILTVGLIPLFRSAGTTLKKIETRQKEATALSQKVAILSQIDQDVLKTRTKVIKAALPETKDIIAYLGAIDGLSKELGLSFGGITISPGDVSGEKSAKADKKGNSKRPVGTLNVLDTDIKIVGNREGIYAFLRQVEQTLPLMQIADVSVSKTAADQYEMTLALGMLWSPTPSSEVKGAISLFTEKEETYFQRLNTFRAYTGSSTESVAALAGKSDLFVQD